MEQKDYREAYEQEHLKCADLAARIADLEARNEELEWKLNRIKGNPLWKVAKPARNCMHWLIRQKDRLKNCGGPRGILQKLAYKKRERAAMRQFGTESFPEPCQIEKERETVFPRMVKISILVPLWNNPRQFQIEMLDSVMNQTYGNFVWRMARTKHTAIWGRSVRSMRLAPAAGLSTGTWRKTAVLRGIPMPACRWPQGNILGCWTRMTSSIPVCSTSM